MRQIEKTLSLRIQIIYTYMINAYFVKNNFL
jgi:hypothetical protein